ncbi:MAG: hypothetical protein R2704_04605 [Microthrixaceae bacterium]
MAGALADRWGQDGVSDNARSIAGMLPIGRQSGVGGDQVTPSTDVVGDPGSPVPPDPAAAHDGEVRWVRRAPGADLDLPATLASARADIAAGRPAGATTVAAVAALLQRLECWPDVVHPTRPLGVGDHGASVATMGLLVAAALDLAAPLAGDSVPAFAGFPSAWWGRPAQFSDLPVADGTVSCALRWHGARPALIWELTPWASLGGRPAPAPLRAPALDPGFSTSEVAGEALLAMPPGAEELLVARAEAAVSAVAVGADANPDGEAADTAGAGDQPSGSTPGPGITMGVDLPTRRRPDGT